MCKQCKKQRWRDIPEIFATQYGPDDNGDGKKSAYIAISEAIRRTKKARSVLRRNKRCTKICDYTLRNLRFSAWVLMVNFENNKGWISGGWMNGYRKIVAGRYNNWFI
jgi:hypothetical protein